MRQSIYMSHVTSIISPLTDLGAPPGERDPDVSRVNQLGSTSLSARG